jgi:uncharacterized protein
MKQFWTWLLLLVLLLCGTAQAEVAVPKLTQRVTDLTNTLDASQIQALNAKLAAFESGKGSQIAVLMLPTTQPETIEQFGIRVVDAWKLGRKGVDDGVLLLIAKDDHKLRIEVGYGLEGALNDATAKRIVSEVITPYLKQRDFFSGIDAGVSAIIKVIEGEVLPPPTPVSHSDSQLPDIGNLFGIAFVIFLVGNVILRQWLGLFPSGLIVGGLIGALVWLVVASLAWTIATGLVSFLLSLILGSNRWDSSSFPTGWGGGGGGGWSSGGGWDFGGGGGGFGGGGASGDW